MPKFLSPKIFSWEEFVDQETEGGVWLIDDILRPGWLGVLGGHGKHGKTTFIIHLLNALRLGTSFLKPCQAVPVIYLSCEMALDDVRGLINDVTSHISTPGETARIISQPELPLKPKWLLSLLEKEEKPGVRVDWHIFTNQKTRKNFILIPTSRYSY